MRAVARASIATAWKLCVIGVLVAALIGTASDVASARVYAPRPPGGGLVENTDGTFSLWGEDGFSKPIRTYSLQEAERLAREDEALAVEAGETGQHASEFIHGVTPAEQDAADQLAAQIQTGKLFATPGEAAVGESIITQAESVGALRTVGSIVETGAPAAVAIATTAYLGLEAGNLFDRTVGWPEFCPFSFLGEAGCSVNKTEVPTEFRIHGIWSKEFKIPGGAHDCSTNYPKIAGLAGDKCMEIEGFYTGEEESYFPEKEKWLGDGPKSHSAYTTWSYAYGQTPECPETGSNLTYRKLKIPATGIVCETVSNGKEKRLYLDASRLKDLQMPAHSHPSWNQSGKTGTATKIKPGTVLTPPHPAEISPSTTTYILHEREKEFPGINEKGEPNTKEEEEEKVIPNPLWPEIPLPTPSEVGTHYVTRLHELGFPNVVERVLEATQANPHVGPEGVAYTSPAEGSRVAPETVIIVEVNPPDAPAPIGGGGGFGVNIPELKLPKLGVLCHNFPFGVPCWLIEEFSAWSATATNPTFTIGAFKVRSTTIGPASVKLESLEPIMSKVRPFMVLFSTIGLVILFYNFAIGGGAPSGGGGDAAGSEAEANIYGDKEVDSDGYWKGW
jgi:hypothetical protein